VFSRQEFVLVVILSSSAHFSSNYKLITESFSVDEQEELVRLDNDIALSSLLLFHSPFGPASFLSGSNASYASG
jgi:hypothetical protein